MAFPSERRCATLGNIPVGAGQSVQSAVASNAATEGDGMASSPDRTRPGLVVRDYQPEDMTAVCTLIEDDRLPGQPPCTAENLAPPAQEPMPVPVADGMPLSAGPHISVATDDNGRLKGAIAYLTWTDADSGAICWLHAR